MLGILNLFSKRQKSLRGEVPDVYTYDSIPNTLRAQIIMIMGEMLGTDLEYRPVNEAYEIIVESLRKEHGVFKLPPSDQRRYTRFDEELNNFLLTTPNAEHAMDVVELAFRVGQYVASKPTYIHAHHGAERVAEAIEELNGRFKEHGVGYQFVDGDVIRVDSQLLHVEAVKPALKLLSGKAYAGAHAEFLNAYEHHRHGRNKEALNECLKAFESTMKAICQKRGWQYQPTDTAKKLIDVCFDKGLVPSFWQTEFASLRSLLESSIPTGRNKLSGHGQGSTPQAVPEYIVAYMLHMTASTIVFLTKAEAALS